MVAELSKYLAVLHLPSDHVSNQDPPAHAEGKQQSSLHAKRSISGGACTDTSDADFLTFLKGFQEKESGWERTQRVSALLGVEAPPYHSAALAHWRAKRAYYSRFTTDPQYAFEMVHAIRLDRVHTELRSYFMETPCVHVK